MLYLAMCALCVSLWTSGAWTAQIAESWSHAGTEVSHNLEEACKDVDIAVLLSGLPPRRSMEDFFAQSRDMYAMIGRALNEHASQHVKVEDTHPCAKTSGL